MGKGPKATDASNYIKLFREELNDHPESGSSIIARAFQAEPFTAANIA